MIVNRLPDRPWTTSFDIATSIVSVEGHTIVIARVGVAIARPPAAAGRGRGVGLRTPGLVDDPAEIVAYVTTLTKTGARLHGASDPRLRTINVLREAG
jgi:hypothetical protein